MKKFLIAALAITTLASCTQDSVIDQNKNNAIQFSNVFVDNSTRAYDPSWSNTKLFSDFAVYGFVEEAPLFNGVQVKGSDLGQEATWTYDNIQYWVAGANYDFCAIAPFSAANDVTTTVESGVIVTSMPFTNTGKLDLVYSERDNVVGQLENNSKVAFTFRHLLSRIRFTFTSAYDATNATIAVNNVKITNAHANGTVTLTNGTTAWSEQANTVALDFGNANQTTENPGAAANDVKQLTNNAQASAFNQLLVIPANATYAITFEVALSMNGEVIKTYNHNATVAIDAQPAHSYNIKATITPQNIDPEHEQEPIEFTVETMSDWTDPEVDVNATIQENTQN